MLRIIANVRNVKFGRMCNVGLQREEHSFPAARLASRSGPAPACRPLPSSRAPPSGKEPGVDQETRDRTRPLKVWVSRRERAEIEARARASSMSLSAYLRAVGLGHVPRS